MAGGLIQLVAQGAESMYLTGNPQMSYFKCVYKRHTNFATEYIEEIFDKTVDFGRTAHCKIGRNADLIHNNGFFWGNHQNIKEPQLEYVADCVDKFMAKHC